MRSQACRNGRRTLLLLVLLGLTGPAVACPLFQHGFENSLPAPAPDDLCPLSDDFENSASLSQWLRVYQTEGWPADQLELWDIGATRAGHMSLMPYTSSWFEDLRGVLVHKLISGDFIVSTRFHANNRAGNGAPQSLYSLAGILVRAPRAITSPADWSPGGENYVFLSAGSADTPGSYQYEVKTTIDSDSQLHIEPACTGSCPGLPIFELRSARLEGEHIILLRRDFEGVWHIHRRYPRPDLPPTLQVGMTVYTDWASIDGVYWPDDPFGHNMTVITGGQPDLLAQFDHFDFRRPHIPPKLAGRNFSAPYDPLDPATVSDAELLSFLAPEPL